MAVTRLFSEQDKKTAERLSSIFQEKKKEEGLTQEILAARLGWSQPTVSQYLKGIVPLKNADAIIRIAKALDVPPDVFCPGFSEKFLKPMSITYAIAKEELDKDRVSTIDNSTVLPYTITVDERYEPVLKVGQKLVIDPLGTLKNGDLVVLQYHHGFRLYNAVKVNLLTKAVVSSPFDLPPPPVRKSRFNKATLAELYPTKPMAVPASKILTLHKLRAIEFPD